MSFYSAIGKQVIPLVVPILIGIGSAAITTTIATARLEERVTTLERKVETNAHIAENLRQRDDDYERRISHTEGLLGSLDKRMTEVSGDIKLLLQRVGR